MLTLRQRILVITGVSVGVIAALILLYLYVFKPKPEQAERAAVQNPVLGQQNGTVQTAPVVTMPTLPPDEVYTRQLAVLFVERFGTYSNQNNNDHIDDVLPLTTDEMGRWVETQRQKSGGVYSGLTTNVVASSVTSLKGGEADIHVDAQIVSDSGKEQSITYKSGKVTLIKEGNTWKVSGLYWDKL